MRRRGGIVRLFPPPKREQEIGLAMAGANIVAFRLI